MLDPIAPFPDSFSLSRFLCVAILVPELHGDFIVIKSEELFTEAVVELTLPFGGEKGYYGWVAGEEERAVAPLGEIGGGVSIPSRDSKREM